QASAAPTQSAQATSGSSHQLPDAPPPPNDPPPPEKPPPPPPPEKPPPPQSEEDEPVGKPTTHGEPPRRPRRACAAFSRALMSYRTMKMTMPTKINRTQGMSSPGCDAPRPNRVCAMSFHSDALPVSTRMASSTPRRIPPGKSLARKRGRIDVSMMKRPIAS